MLQRNYFEMLMKNFRLSEALGYIASLVDCEKISLERSNDIENLIRGYKNVVCNFLWDKEGVLALEITQISTSSDDIIKEKKRLCDLIQKWGESEKRLLLLYISAYYAMVNEDRMCLNRAISEISGQIKEETLKSNIENAIGAYEKMQIIGNVLEEKCDLKMSIFDVIQEASVKIQLSEI